MIGQFVTGREGQRFTILKEIGRGGFGVVYLVEDNAKNVFAMKLIAPVSDPTARLSFEQEIKSTLGLSHGNLLRIIDFGVCTLGNMHALFAVSEYCPDGDYRQALSAYSPTSSNIEMAVGDIRQILSGLTVLHTKIIHRDLKPENVFIAEGKLKMGDFGLAKFVDEATRTLTFKGAGTPLYMAPEAWLGQRATAATDLYAVGVMLFEALTGRPPFTAQDANTLRDLHLYSPAPRVKPINKDVPDFLDGVIKKLLAKEPHDRYQAAAEVLDALQAVPAPGPEVAELAARMRAHHDAEEAEYLKHERMIQMEQDSASRNRYKEQELLAVMDDVVSDLNAQLAETKIQASSRFNGRDYHLSSRTLFVHFFGPGQMYLNPLVPGRMETLRKHHVVHGGYIEIRESGQGREGWNLVLVRPPESMYGEWRIVETRVSPFSGRGTQYEPIATEAAIFADNLACHWVPCMHVYQLTDKTLETEDILKILGIFIPKT